MTSETNGASGHALAPDEFPRLLRRLLILVSQLRLASKDFGDLSKLPKVHVAAALVAQDASAELYELYDRLNEWHARHEGVGKAIAAESAAGSAHLVSLVLKEYAPDRKVSVIRALRQVVPGLSLTEAKALVERELPTHIADGLARDEAAAMIAKFEAAGAICRIGSITQ